MEPKPITPEKPIVRATMTPTISGVTPIKPDAPDEMTFYEALSKCVEGKKIRRVSWGDVRHYGVMDGDILAIHKAGELNTVLHPWIVNDGDILGIDWVVIPE